MATNLETKNALERDETKEELAGLKKEVETPVNRELESQIFDCYKNFKRRSALKYNPIIYGIRESSDAKESGLRMEKMKGERVRLSSYGETCEVDVKTGQIWFLKGNNRIELSNRGSSLWYLFENKNYRRFRFALFQVFGSIHLINRAASVSKNHPNKKFYFEDGNLLQKLDPTENKDRILKIDGEYITSKGQLKMVGLRDEKQLLNDLNKIVA